jgi:tetratricopeptide (TPR) repeat protein
MKPNSLKTLISIVVIVFGFGLTYVLSNFLEKNRPPLPEGIEDADMIVQTAKLKGYALGFEGLIADWYWMKSLQYIGDKIFNNKQNINLEDLTALNPRLLYPYLDTATTLDPHFIEVYSYGALILPAIDRQQAIELTEKGIADNPDEWRLYQHLGYIYWRLEDYEKAAEVYARGATIKDAPSFMRSMSARMKNQGNDRETARAIYAQMYQEAEDDQSREAARIRLMELDSLDERDGIRRALKDFQAKNNRCAEKWTELLPFLKTIKLPNNRDFRLDNSNNIVDPSGAAYILDKKNCEVTLNVKETKIPIR